jgi:kynurenine formamidase
MQLIDLSHILEADMPMFSESAPGPQIDAWMSHQDAMESGNYLGCTCEISQVKFLTSLGTYLDSPFHFHPDKGAIESLKLQQLVLPGVMIDCTYATARQPIDPEILSGVDISGKAVLFYSGWSRYWGYPEYNQFPYLTKETAQALVKSGAKMAGVDWLVIDDTSDPTRPVHVKLLANDILIIENLTNLKSLPTSGFTFHAAPVKFKGSAAFPVRAYAVIDET